MPIAMYPGSFDPVTRGHLDIIKRSSRIFARQKGATVMVRGLRAVTDFENEMQLAHTNYAMMPEIETVFLATAIKWSYLSSTVVREAAHYGQDVSRFVPPYVEAALIAKREAGEL